MRKVSGLDIVTRLYDVSDLACLDRLLFSIMGQTGTVPLRLHVMLQRFSFIEVQQLRDATQELRRLNGRVSVTFHNWDYPPPFDLRVPLLNWSLEVAQGRYLMCLEVQDQLRPHACAALMTRLRTTPAALAVGSIAFQPIRWWGDVILPVPEQDDTLAPAPIFIIDRRRVASKDCVFKTGESGSEITQLIENISIKYAVDTAYQGHVLALRQHSLDSVGL